MAQRLSSFAFVLIVVWLLRAMPTVAEEVRVSYDFEPPVTEAVQVGDTIFDRLQMPETTNGGKIGYPALPSRGAQILLPFGTEVKSIRVEPGDQVRLSEQFVIEPVARPYALSKTPAAISLPQPDPIVYALDRMVPEQLYENIGVQQFRGYSILVLKLHPVQYRPRSGELIWFDRLTVVVEVSSGGSDARTHRALPQDREAVQRRVDNPNSVSLSAGETAASVPSYDMLILTTPLLASGFQPLADHHNANGVITEIHTTNDVGSNFPTQVRDYIRQEYLTSGIQYVLIGADDDLIPARDLYVEGWGDGPVVSDLPGDIYFACLDGTFNYDGDALWGEITDGEDGGDVDLMAEVWVGRASVDNLTEAARFVSKTLAYLTSSDPYLDKVLMAGGQIGLGGLAEFGGNSMDEIVDGSTSHGYPTVGIPSGQFLIDKLYDRDRYWSGAEMIARINQGRHIINHYGHSNVDYALKVTSTGALTGLTNSQLCFVYSQGCLAGHFDGMDCFAETMNIKTDHGAFALVMNARQGYGTFATTDGPSQRYNREFWDAVFSPMEGKPQLGQAHHDSKEDNLYRINEACMRWCYYETTLFGDPAVSVKEVRTLRFDYGAAVPDHIPLDVPTTLEVTVQGVGLGQPVAGTARLHLSRNGSPFTESALTETAMNHYEAPLPALDCGEQVEFYLSAEEAVNGRVYESSSGYGHVIHAGEELVTVFQDDFETATGWKVSGGQWERGTPLGLGGNAGAGPDPAAAHSGASVYGYNLAGNYGPSLDEKYLTSPPIDCSNVTGVRLRFYRWLGLESPPYDRAYIRVSTDGFDWSTAWTNTSEIWDPAWNLVELDISDYADLQPTVYIRFVMGETNFALEYCGWNIDDLAVIGYACDDTSDTDNDGVLNSVDNCILVANPNQADADGDDIGDLCDYCTDTDGDAYGDPGFVVSNCPEDNCPDIANPEQTDADLDMIGDSCDTCTDTDGDGYGNPGFPHNTCIEDNCPDDFNPDQADIDSDGIGNVCDGCCMPSTVGDVDQSGGVDITDISLLIDNQFLTLTPLVCDEEADIDFSGLVDITDLSILIDNQFLTLAPLPPCP